MKTLKDVNDEKLQELLEQLQDAAVQLSEKGSKEPITWIDIDNYVEESEDELVTYLLDNYRKKTRATEHMMGS